MLGSIPCQTLHFKGDSSFPHTLPGMETNSASLLKISTAQQQLHTTNALPCPTNIVYPSPNVSCPPTPAIALATVPITSGPGSSDKVVAQTEFDKVRHRNRKCVAPKRSVAYTTEPLEREDCGIVQLDVFSVFLSQPHLLLSKSSSATIDSNASSPPSSQISNNSDSTSTRELRTNSRASSKQDTKRKITFPKFTRSSSSASDQFISFATASALERMISHRSSDKPVVEQVRSAIHHHLPATAFSTADDDDEMETTPAAHPLLALCRTDKDTEANSNISCKPATSERKASHECDIENEAGETDFPMEDLNSEPESDDDEPGEEVFSSVDDDDSADYQDSSASSKKRERAKDRQSQGQKKKVKTEEDSDHPDGNFGPASFERKASSSSSSSSLSSWGALKDSTNRSNSRSLSPALSLSPFYGNDEKRNPESSSSHTSSRKDSLSSSNTVRRNNSSSSSRDGAPKTRAAPTKATKPRPDFLKGGAMIKDHKGEIVTVSMAPFEECACATTNVVWKGQPLPVPEDAPRRNELNPEELETCEILRLTPVQYLDIKETLLATVVVRGPYKKRDAQGWFRIDVNKTNKLYDWFVGVGWIDIATSEWEKRVKQGLA